uniref:Uncharacterized protein n=1 Tax=Cacopsylla melanoneura TaxID=428564 RepID=A0A8D8Y9N3_9HEMI
MPKLKPVGGRGQNKSSNNSSSNENSEPSTPKSGNVSSLHNSRETTPMKSSGPAPPIPQQNNSASHQRNLPSSASDSVLTSPPPSHSRGGSTSSLNAELVNRISNGLNKGPPPGGYGKPNLAPKPPAQGLAGVRLAGKTGVSRSQSTRVPRSPPIAPPPPSIAPKCPNSTMSQNDLHRLPSSELGGMGRMFHQSQDSLIKSSATLPHQLRARPSARPPPPPSKVAMNPPLCAPPPPPNNPPPPPPHSRVTPPPPPPSAQNRLAPFVPSPAPPPPPVRNSSMRSGADVETRCQDRFHGVHEFPPPPHFQGVVKVYNSRIHAKQQAPQPPNVSSTKHWQRSEHHFIIILL